MKIDDFPEEYKKQLKLKLEIEDARKTTGKASPSVPAANVEQTVSLPSLATKEDKGLDTRRSILITSYRYRPTDADGASGKAVIDGCVHRGILEDDSTEFVKEVRFKQVKIPKDQPERTIVEIYECTT